MTASPADSDRKLAANKKALRDYFVLERFEAGVELRGTEVKSVRAGQVSLAGGFARIEKTEAILYGFNIAVYEHGNRFNHDPNRPKRLLLHRREILKLQAHTEQQGHALVPLAVVVRRGKVKVELGLCRGKSQHDKRETIRRKTADREADREMARHQHRPGRD